MLLQGSWVSTWGWDRRVYHSEVALLSLLPTVMGHELSNGAKVEYVQQASWGIAQRGQS